MATAMGFPDEAPPPYTFLSSSSVGDYPVDHDTKNKVKRPGAIHHVSRNDTLYGVAILYGVSVMTLKLANRLFSDDIYAVGSLFIPNATISKRPVPDEDKIRKSLVKRFQLISKCQDVDEARSYVARNEWDVSKALEYWADLRWERESGKANTSVPSRRVNVGSSGKWKRIV